MPSNLSHTLDVGGHSCVLTRIPIKERLQALSIVTEAVLPLIAAGARLVDLPVFSDQVVKSVTRLHELGQIYAKHATIDWADRQNVPMNKMFDACFAESTVAFLDWVLECTMWHFADFLAENGLSQLEEKVSLFASQIGLTGGSGVSSATPASP
jgi:hypothetical protein